MIISIMVQAIFTAILNGSAIATAGDFLESEAQPANPPMVGERAAEPDARSAANDESRLDRYGDPLPSAAVARLGTVRYRHPSIVMDVAYSPDGKTIATACGDRNIYLWDVATGREIRRLSGHRRVIRFVTYTPDGRHIISASGFWQPGMEAQFDPGCTIRKWDAATGQEVGRLLANECAETMTTVALSPDGKVLAAGRGEDIHIADVMTGQKIGSFHVPKGNAWCVTFSPNGKQLAGVFKDVGVCLFDLKEMKTLWQSPLALNNAFMPKAVFAPDCKSFVVVSGNHNAMVEYDTATGGEIHRFLNRLGSMQPATFSRDGKFLFTGTLGHQVAVWERTTGQLAATLMGASGGIRALALSPDGKTLACARGHAIQFWNVATRKMRVADSNPVGSVTALALPDSHRVLSAAPFYQEEGVRLWNTGTGQSEIRMKGQWELGTVVMLPAGDSFVANVLNVGRLPSVQRIKNPGEARFVKGTPSITGQLAISPNGALLVGSDIFTGLIEAWNPRTGDELPPIGQFRAKFVRPLTKAFTPDSRYLALGGHDSLVHLWDVVARKEIRVFAGQQGSVQSVAISPNGRLIAASPAQPSTTSLPNLGFKEVHVWDLATGHLKQTLIGSETGSWCLAFSPDGRVLAAGGEDHTIRLWELASGKERGRLPGHRGPVRALAFTPDGRRLISGSADTTILVWDPTRLVRVSASKATAFPRLWDELAHQDAARALHAIVAFAKSGDEAAVWLGKRPPRAMPAAEQVAHFIAALDANDFQQREQATRELEGLGDAVVPAVKRAQAARPTPEAARRLERISAALEKPSSETLRQLRTVEILERIASPAAKQSLNVLAKDSTWPLVAGEAKAALKRLNAATKP